MITIIIGEYGELTNPHLLSPLMCSNIDFHMDTCHGKLLVNADLETVISLYKDEKNGEFLLPKPYTFIGIEGSMQYTYSKGNIYGITMTSNDGSYVKL